METNPTSRRVLKLRLRGNDTPTSARIAVVGGHAELHLVQNWGVLAANMTANIDADEARHLARALDMAADMIEDGLDDGREDER